MDFVKEILRIVITGAVGTAGLTLVYNVGKRVYIPAVVGAVLTGSVYKILEYFIGNVFVAALISSAVAAIYSEIMAHLLKTPTTVLLIPGILLLVPGGPLYYTMFGLSQGNSALAAENAVFALRTALGVSIGIIVVTFLMRTVFPGLLWGVGRNRNKNGKPGKSK